MPGLSGGEFIDKQDYAGPLYVQIEEAYAFVLRNIRRGASVRGLIRRECHELPPNAIREMIINAHCHRNFLDESCVQVALYDDRLEVTSPGGLYHGLTLEEALSGRSRQRNRAVAEVFNQMGLIEGWGNGLKSIRANAREYGLPEPEFIEMPETFRVNLFRRPLPMYEGKYDVGVKHWQSIGEASVEEQQSIGEVSAAEQQSVGEAWEEDRQNIGVVPVGHPRGGNVEMNATQHRIVEFLSEDSSLTGAALAGRLGISKRNIEANIRKLRESGVLVRHGSSRSGYWEVVG